jgi:hypothetical protein
MKGRDQDGRGCGRDPIGSHSGAKKAWNNYAGLPGIRVDRNIFQA